MSNKNFLLSNKFELPGSKPNYNPDRPVQVKHIFLDLKIDFDEEILTGTSHLTVIPVQSEIGILEINACEMTIFSVKIENKATEFGYDGSIIRIFPKNVLKIGQKITVSIDYQTEKPKLGLNFVKPTKDYPNKPLQAWTQGESEQSRYWYPCFDFPKQIATSEIRIEVPKGMTAVSNGILDSTELHKTGKIFHWKQNKPHPNYLMTMAIGEFVEQKDQYKNILVNYYTMPSKKDELHITAAKTPKMIEFFGRIFGVEYPWDKYSQIWVHDFIWGGMENTSATINTDRALVDEKAAKDYTFGEVLVAHELAHQWFGDLVVIDHWSHLWVKEGAATYSESLWWQHEYGDDEFNYYRLTEWREYLAESYKRTTVTNVYRHVEDLYDRHSYTKAGTVYHMIRTELGDDGFSKALKLFLSENKHKNVEGVDLLRAVEQATGKNLLPLFDQYLHTSGHPDFKVGYQWDSENGLAKISVAQKQVKNKDDHENLFKLKIPLAFGFLEKKDSLELKKISVQIDQPEQVFYIPLDKKPDFISFDHGNNYLKNLELDFALPELKNQLLHNPDPIARIFAAEFLSKKGNLESLKVLEDAFNKEKFWAVRAEIAGFAAKINLDQSFNVLKTFLQDKDCRVRTEAIKGLSKFKTEESFKLLKKLTEKQTESYFEEAAILMVLGKAAKSLDKKCVDQAIKIFEQVLAEKAGWNEVVRSGAISGLAFLNNSPKALEIILAYTKAGISSHLRTAAIGKLGQAAAGQTEENVIKVLDRLETVAGENYILTEMALIQSLSQIISPGSVSILNQIAQKTIYGRTQRKAEEAAEKVHSQLNPRKSIEELRKQIEEVEKENKNLKSRVEELEAKKKN